MKLTTASYWRPNDENIHRGRDKDGKKVSVDEIWGVRPSSGCGVKLKDAQRRRMARARRRRDYENLLGPDNQPMVIESDENEDGSEDEPDEPVDPQLDKAVERLLELIKPQVRAA